MPFWNGYTALPKRRAVERARRLTRSLAGLKVLVTRPRERAAELCAALRAAGAEVRQLPLLAIVPLDMEADRERLQRNRQLAMALDRYQRIVCVSVTAVEHGLGWLENFWPQWPLGQHWYGVGAATARALTARGLPASQPGGAMNSEALLALPDWQDMTDQRVLIIRGVGGRDFLAGELRQRGAQVDFMECYRRNAPPARDAAALREAAEWADAIGVSSGQTLAHLEQLWRAGDALPADLEAQLILPGARVAELARQAGFRHRLVAENAGTPATLAVLQQWWCANRSAQDKLDKEAPGRE